MQSYNCNHLRLIWLANNAIAMLYNESNVLNIQEYYCKRNQTTEIIAGNSRYSVDR